MTRKRSKTWGTSECPHCGNSFPKRRKNQVYCTPAHRIAFNNERRMRAMELLEKQEKGRGVTEARFRRTIDN